MKGVRQHEERAHSRGLRKEEMSEGGESGREAEQVERGRERGEGEGGADEDRSAA